eukprot:1464923-Rhodomonas_salina.1
MLVHAQDVTCTAAGQRGSVADALALAPGALLALVDARALEEALDLLDGAARKLVHEHADRQLPLQHRRVRSELPRYLPHHTRSDFSVQRSGCRVQGSVQGGGVGSKAVFSGSTQYSSRCTHDAQSQ